MGRPRLSKDDDEFLYLDLQLLNLGLQAIRHLAHGLSYVVLSHAFLIGISTVRQIVDSVTQAIIEELEAELLAMPTKERWQEIEREFSTFWNHPNCIGAMDGKHFACEKPSLTGSEYFNYKKYFSISIIAIVDAQYQFTCVDVGGEGGQSDSSLFARSTFRERLRAGQANIPEPALLPGIDVPLPHVIVADEGFGMDVNIMRPYARSTQLTQQQRVYNYRLSRARRIVENSFGILANRWRLFRGTMKGTPKSCSQRIYATIILHNYLRSANIAAQPQARYLLPSMVDRERDDDGAMRVESGDWRQEGMPNSLTQHRSPGGANWTKEYALQIRDLFSDYFSSAVGAVPWQLKTVDRGLQ